MRSLKPLLLLQVLFGVSTAATDFLRPNVSDSQVAKRWFTVQDAQHSVPHETRTWPPLDNMEGPRIITYCFEDDTAYRIMGDLLDDALAKWRPATEVSSLAFEPDSACTGIKGPCMCSTNGVEEVTVHLMLGGDGVNQAQASSGYWDPFLPKVHPNRPRHYIQWPAVWVGTRVRAVLELAHELSHIVGFAHEHQRGDARQYVRFHCDALDWYEEAKAHLDSIKNGEEAFTPGMSAEEKTAKVCDDWRLARKYFLPALPYTPAYPYVVARWQKSEQFDYNSITIYSSSVELTGHPIRKPVITTIDGKLIYQGGHPNPEKAGLSRLEIERVVALYPLKHVNPQLIQQKPLGKRLVVPDVLTTAARPGPLTGASGEATNVSQQNDADAQLAKRWFSIPVNQKIELPGGRHLWPKSSDGRHTVSYCFEDAESHHYLKDVFNKALAIWAPAIRESSLTFAPDAACVGQQWQGRCLCSRDGVSVDTLRIQATDGIGADATCGYTDRPDGLRNVLRHSKEQDKWQALSMAHELGHVIGLEHEHQRPDANQYLSYDLEAFLEYQEVKAKVESVKTEDEPIFTTGMSIEERLNLVTTHVDLANKYFPSFRHSYMPSEKARALEHSTKFDYKSIMIYNSLRDGRPNDRPIFKTRGGELIWQGGNADPKLGCLSQLDIERVALLYPKQHVNPPGNRPGKRSSDTNALEVEFPSELTTTITPVPTKFPRSANDSSASQTPADTQVAKRWYSLPTSQEQQPQPPSKFGLWPECGGMHIVTYCYEIFNTYSLVGANFMQAIAKWTPAIVSPDAYYRSTFGYLDPRLRRSDLHKPSHYIAVSSDERHSKQFSILMIAHHLGHVVGLMNEHQRGDAHHYVRFNCMALNGYEDAKRAVSPITDEPLFTTAQIDDEKMAIICQNFELATKYFAQATQFMPHPTRIVTKLRASGEFDYKSIMIYHSWMGKQTALFPLLTYIYEPILMGGSEYPGLGGLSELDIERIAALYPPALVEPDPVVGGPNEKRSGDASALPAKQPTLEVIFPGELTTTVKPVPVPMSSAKPPNLKDGDSTGKLPNRVARSVREILWIFSGELVSYFGGGSDGFLYVSADQHASGRNRDSRDFRRGDLLSDVFPFFVFGEELFDEFPVSSSAVLITRQVQG